MVLYKKKNNSLCANSKTVIHAQEIAKGMVALYQLIIH